VGELLPLRRRSSFRSRSSSGRSPVLRGSTSTSSAAIWTRLSIRIRRRVPERRRAGGIVDTSVVIDVDLVQSVELPGAVAISAVTLAELAAGPHAAADPAEVARR